MIMVERHNIKPTPEIIHLCELAKELYNKCNYLIRKAWFGRQPLPDIGSLIAATKDLDCFKQFGNTKTAKQTIRRVLIDWTNFKKARNAFKKTPHKFLKKPKPPYYKKKLSQVVFYNETIKGGQSGKQLTELTANNHCFSVPFSKPYRQVVITPQTFGIVIEISYDAPDKPKAKVKKERFCSIDIGLNNLCAITSDQHRPILVNGRILKSINQWYNKRPCRTRSRKRYWRIENYFHHVSNFVVQNAIKHQISRIIIGKNDGWKQRINMGKKNNQNFQSIPFYKLLAKIKYKAEAVGIEVVFVEESYTSKSSYFDNDPLPEWKKNAPEPTFSGRRAKRGLYVSKDGFKFNADVNGSLNIGRKFRNVTQVSERSEVLERDKVIPEHQLRDRSLAARPVVINPLRLSA
jgi:IS605 OrfB family transposase